VAHRQAAIARDTPLAHLRDTRLAPFQSTLHWYQDWPAVAGPQKEPIGPNESGITTQRTKPVRSVQSRPDDQWKGDTQAHTAPSTNKIFPQPGRGSSALPQNLAPPLFIEREKNEYRVDRAYSELHRVLKYGRKIRFGTYAPQRGGRAEVRPRAERFSGFHSAPPGGNVLWAPSNICPEYTMATQQNIRMIAGSRDPPASAAPLKQNLRPVDL
jgi:hypothetical protein